VTTKKDAAANVYWIAQRIREKLEGDEDADLWVMLLENLAHSLDPKTERYILEPFMRDPKPSVQVKLRRLIEHPATPQPEREAAINALARLRLKR